MKQRGPYTALLLGLLLTAGACSSSSESASNDPEYFEIAMGSTTYDYLVMETPGELAELSDRVVSGTIVDIRDGRRWESKTASLNRRFVVLEIEVIQTFVGKSEPSVYVEVPVGSRTELDKLKESVPDEVFVLFLDESNLDAPTLARSVDSFDGRPAESTLFAPMSPQGFLIDREGKLQSALGGDPFAPWPEISADEIGAHIEGFLDDEDRQQGGEREENDPDSTDGPSLDPQGEIPVSPDDE